MPTTLPDDWCLVGEFHERLPGLHTSLHALRWELRFRHENGLIADEVVLERRADPRASRPTILISPSRYLAWLRRGARAAAG